MPWDPELASLPPLQLIWLREQILADQQQEFDEKLQFVEYLASFINPDAVKRIKDSRNKQNESDNDVISALARITGDAESAKKVVKK